MNQILSKIQRTILLIIDGEELKAKVEHMNLGFQKILLAHTKKEAEDIIQNNPVDSVIIDCKMDEDLCITKSISDPNNQNNIILVNVKPERYKEAFATGVFDILIIGTVTENKLKDSILFMYTKNHFDRRIRCIKNTVKLLNDIVK